MSYISVTDTGIDAAPFAVILDDLRASYRAIYGADIYLDNDSQDGQFLALVASVISDTASAAVDIYRSFSPLTAKADALSTNVAINGLSRALASNSACQLLLVGVAGTTITNGIVGDQAGVRWLLPPSVVIGPSGAVSVSATAETVGAIIALPNTVNKILNPTRGWQSATNPAPATLGNPIETDAGLRTRQRASVALPSQGLLDGMVGGVAALAGVSDWRGYENDTDTTDANGLPPKSIAMVVAGGDSAAIAGVILAKKTLGAKTVGDVAVTLNDAQGYPVIVRYYAAEALVVSASVTIDALAGYSDAIGQKIKQSIVDAINAAGIGGFVSANRLAVAAGLGGQPESATYDVLSVVVNGGPNLQAGFKQLPTAIISGIDLGVA